MNEFLTQHILEIIFGLVSTGALAFCRYFYVQMKNYKTLVDEKKHEEFEELIDSRINPILEEIEELRKCIRQDEATSQANIALINSSFRYHLIQLCREYLKQGFMTQQQCDELSELFKVYQGLGGNGQAKEYYEKAMELSIKG